MQKVDEIDIWICIAGIYLSIIIIDGSKTRRIYWVGENVKDWQEATQQRTSSYQQE